MRKCLQLIKNQVSLCHNQKLTKMKNIELYTVVMYREEEYHEFYYRACIITKIVGQHCEIIELEERVGNESYIYGIGRESFIKPVTTYRKLTNLGIIRCVFFKRFIIENELNKTYTAREIIEYLHSYEGVTKTNQICKFTLKYVKAEKLMSLEAFNSICEKRDAYIKTHEK